MKTSKLTGTALDWAVAKCEGDASFGFTSKSAEKTALLCIEETWRKFKPSTDWSQGGQIIERELLRVQPFISKWIAHIDHTPAHADDPTPLIAAMRCFVASKLGEEIEIPVELTI